MIQHEDGSVTLEGSERVNIEKEIEWLVHDWLPDDKYDGALIWSAQGRAAGYMLMPYVERPRPRDHAG